MRCGPLLTNETFAAFEGAITAREAAHQTQTSEIRSIQEAVIEDASLSGTMAEISVRFVSDQISQTLDRPRQTRHPAPSAVTELRDVWHFVRDPGPLGPDLAFGAGPLRLSLELPRRWTLHCGDCLEIMAGMDPASVDVVVTSPPYNLGIAYGRYNDTRAEADYLDWMERVAAAIRRGDAGRRVRSSSTSPGHRPSPGCRSN